jgi:putative transposase
MFLTPLSSLTWAYQLHYYLCFRTRSRLPHFSTDAASVALKGITAEICERHDYRLLEQDTYADEIRCLLSLKPNQAVAKVTQTIKANSARECGESLGLIAPVWERGYLARSTGRMKISAVRHYLEQQATNHGYANRVLPPVYRYRPVDPVVLKAAHGMFDLTHHVVFATRYRRGVFTSSVGEALSNYWLRVASKRGFTIDQISLVPDHVHSIVRIAPKMSIEECVLSLMNNGQHFIGEHYPELLVETGLDQLWESSAYAGTFGEVTTALLKTWLRNE